MSKTITGASDFHATQDQAISEAVRDLRNEVSQFKGEHEAWECWGLNITKQNGFGYSASILLRDFTLTDDDATWAGGCDLSELLDENVSCESFASYCHWYEADWVMGDKESIEA